MKRLYNMGFAGLISMIFLSGVYAQDNKATKNYHQEYPAGKNTQLVIDNKYGAIDVKNWNQDKITIDVVITIENTNPEKAKKLLEYLNVNFSQQGDKIEAVTSIDDKFNSGGSWFHFGSEGREFSINYTVNLPSWLDVNISNKYGDIFINELTGPTHIFLKYGNMKANKILRGNEDPMATITMGYANATIEECNWLKLDLKYSKFNAETGKAYVIVSKYSKLYLGECSSVVSDSKYDDYRVGRLTNFVVTAAYSGFKMKELDRKLDASLKYSGLSIDNVPATFESIKIENGYGGISIGIVPNASYIIDGEAHYAKISVPDGKYDRVEENTSSTIKGLVGKDEKTKSRVNIETSYGGVKLTD